MARKQKVEEGRTLTGTRFFYVTDPSFNLPINCLFKVREWKNPKFSTPDWEFTKVKSKQNQNIFCKNVEIFHLKMAMRENMSKHVLDVFDDIDEALSAQTPEEKNKERIEMSKVVAGVFDAPLESSAEPESENITHTQRPAQQTPPKKSGGGKMASDYVPSMEAKKTVVPTTGQKVEPEKKDPYKDWTPLPYGCTEQEWKALVTSALKTQKFDKKTIKKVMLAANLQEQIIKVDDFIAHTLSYRGRCEYELLPSFAVIKKIHKAGLLDDGMLYYYERLLNEKAAQDKIDNKTIIQIGSKKFNLKSLPKKYGLAGSAAILAGKGIVGAGTLTASALGSAYKMLKEKSEEKQAEKLASAESDKSREIEKQKENNNTVTSKESSNTIHTKENTASEKIVEKSNEVNKAFPFIPEADGKSTKVEIADDHIPSVMRSGRREQTEESDKENSHDRIEFVKTEIGLLKDGLFDIFEKIEKRFLKPKQESTKVDNKVTEADSLKVDEKQVDTVSPTVAPVAGNLTDQKNKLDEHGQETTPKGSLMGRIGDKLMDKGLDKIFKGKSPVEAPRVPSKGGFLSRAGKFALKGLKLGRAIPLVGTAIGAGFLAKSIYDGDKAGMALNAAAMVPGLGTAATVADMAREQYNESHQHLEAVQKERASEMEAKKEEIIEQTSKAQEKQHQNVIDASKKVNIIQAGGGGGQSVRLSPRTSDSTLRDYQRSRTHFSGSPR